VTRRLIGEFARTAPGPDSAAAAGAGAAGAGAIGARAGAGPEVVGRITSNTRCTADQLARVLTDRELEVLAMVARGLSNGEIAEGLTISPATAKTHVAHLLTKLDARDRIQLVIIAYQSGLVTTLQ
jgi:DNA-binding NarL/FixJ family response regulator